MGKITHSLLFYSHNLAPGGIIAEALRQARNHVATHEDAELLICSHLPLTEAYEDVSDQFEDISSREKKYDQGLVQGNILGRREPRIRAFVTGKLQYNITTIVRQLLFLAHKAQGDNVLLLEHDVFYPSDEYFGSMVDALLVTPWAFYAPCIFLDRNGYMGVEYTFYNLSRYAARRDAMVTFMDSKLKRDSFRFLEPVLKNAGKPQGGVPPEDEVEVYTIVVDGSPVLDFKHGANTSGMIVVDAHSTLAPFWGPANAWTRLIDDRFGDFCDQNPNLAYGLNYL